VPFIAETGGLNGMFVDTTALREQVIDDVVLSAFGSAGQRCSALRLLFLPHDTADDHRGRRRRHGRAGHRRPADPATDVGPVIDEEAKAILDRHTERVQRRPRC
jgi:RHH-type proline utilization regulon transcriptional repressor/proline dehydrogenase/delta 1-pyrroline-5-carboxylate dehydrogenase